MLGVACAVHIQVLVRCESGSVAVGLRGWLVPVVMLGSVGVFVTEVILVYCEAYAVGVEVGDVEDFEARHDWLGVCFGWLVGDDADDLLVCSDERL